MLNLVHRRFGGFPLTGRLEMRYKKRIKIGQTIVADARISSSTRKTIWAECEVRSGGHVCSTGQAMFVILTSDVAGEGYIIACLALSDEMLQVGVQSGNLASVQGLYFLSKKYGISHT